MNILNKYKVFNKLFESEHRCLNFGLMNQFATKMQASSTQNTKDSAGKRLGVKRFGGQEVFPMDIIVRQRGAKYKPGSNAFMGKDYTIHAKKEGVVQFEKNPYQHKKYWTVNILDTKIPNRYVKSPPPYCYHPELFPELAANNPAPTNLLKKKNYSQNKTKRNDLGVLDQTQNQLENKITNHSNLISFISFKKSTQSNPMLN